MGAVVVDAAVPLVVTLLDRVSVSVAVVTAVTVVFVAGATEDVAAESKVCVVSFKALIAWRWPPRGLAAARLSSSKLAMSCNMNINTGKFAT